jgi:hypothetical protein
MFACAVFGMHSSVRCWSHAWFCKRSRVRFRLCLGVLCNCVELYIGCACGDIATYVEYGFFFNLDVASYVEYEKIVPVDLDVASDVP